LDGSRTWGIVVIRPGRRGGELDRELLGLLTGNDSEADRPNQRRLRRRVEPDDLGT
jgi:hypothetical protein